MVEARAVKHNVIIYAVLSVLSPITLHYVRLIACAAYVIPDFFEIE